MRTANGPDQGETFALLVPHGAFEEKTLSKREIALKYFSIFDELYSAVGAVLTTLPLMSSTLPFSQGLLAETLGGPVWNIVCDVIRFLLASPDFFKQADESVTSKKSRTVFAVANLLFFSLILPGATLASYISVVKDYESGRFLSSDVSMGNSTLGVLSDAAFGLGLLVAAWPQCHSMLSYYQNKKDVESLQLYLQAKKEKSEERDDLSPFYKQRIAHRANAFLLPADETAALANFQKNKWAYKNSENTKDFIGNVTGFLGAFFGCVAGVTDSVAASALCSAFFALSAIIKWYQLFSGVFQTLLSAEDLKKHVELPLTEREQVLCCFSQYDLLLLAREPSLLEKVEFCKDEPLVPTWISEAVSPV